MSDRKIMDRLEPRLLSMKEAIEAALSSIQALSERLTKLESAIADTKAHLLMESHDSIVATVNAAVDCIKKDLNGMITEQVKAMPVQATVDVPAVVAALASVEPGASRVVVSGNAAD